MLTILKNGLPYALILAACVWLYNLNSRVAEVEAQNAQLQVIIETYEEAARKSDAVLANWLDSKRAIDANKQYLQENLYTDTIWDSGELPADYIRVLREAGYYCGTSTSAASGDTDAGSSDTEAQGRDK